MSAVGQLEIKIHHGKDEWEISHTPQTRMQSSQRHGRWFPVSQHGSGSIYSVLLANTFRPLPVIADIP